MLGALFQVDLIGSHWSDNTPSIKTTYYQQRPKETKNNLCGSVNITKIICYNLTDFSVGHIEKD